MKDFEKLTHRGQAKRLRDIAQAALEDYDLTVRAISLLEYSYNAIFKVDAADSNRYVVRVSLPDVHSKAEIRSEMVWLEALKKDTELSVPTPVRTRNGKLVTTVEIESVPEARHCSVFEWVEGRHLRRKPSVKLLRKMGGFLAQLHDHADTFNAPKRFQRPKLDTVWAFGKPAMIYSDEPHILFPDARRELFQSAAERIEKALNKLYADESNLRILHADFHLSNIKIERGSVNALDFDDCSWGYPIQDIGIALYYQQRYRHYKELRQAFLKGYTSSRTIPKQQLKQLDLFIAQRELMVVNYVIQSSNPAMKRIAQDYVARAERRLREWFAATTS